MSGPNRSSRWQTTTNAAYGSFEADSRWQRVFLPALPNNTKKEADNLRFKRLRTTSEEYGLFYVDGTVSPVDKHTPFISEAEYPSPKKGSFLPPIKDSYGTDDTRTTEITMQTTGTSADTLERLRLPDVTGIDLKMLLNDKTTLTLHTVPKSWHTSRL